MELSLKSEYALLALIELANNYDRDHPLQIKQIATLQNIPDRYLEQLLASLKRQGLVRSQRGAKGGYILAREPWQISILEIIRSVEGSNPFLPRQPEGGVVSPALAALLEVWYSAQSAAEAILQEYTLKDLCELAKQKSQVGVMYYI
ncbi:MAG: Rrf2 family transcriptional regulator [Pseudanabaenaceae cyanobacterium]